MDLIKLGEGRLAEVFAWEADRVIKVYKDTSPESASARAAAEAKATREVFGRGVPAPRCFETERVGDRLGVVLERFPGPMLGEEVLTGRAEAAIKDLAKLQAAIHSRSGKGLTPIVPSLMQKVGNVLPKDQAATISSRISELSTGESILHSDLHVFNAMRNDAGRAIAIDWDAALSGPALYGVARSLFLIAEAHPGDAVAPIPDFDTQRRRLGELYLDEYSKHRELDRPLLALWRKPVLAVRLAEPIAEERDFLLGELAKGD